MTKKIIPIEILEINDIRRSIRRTDEVLNYFYKHYSHFQNERSKIFSKLKNSLDSVCKTYSFKNWHRVITYKYSNNPLSAHGSLVNDPGGRFNIGDIDQIKFPAFPALYIAEDYETAYREKFQMPQNANFNGLTSDELALNKSMSNADLLLEGEINTVVDLSNKKQLQKFYEMIKVIKLSKELENEAKELELDIMYEVNSLKNLWETILDPHWRAFPMQVDVPSNSQIFGQIVHASNIEAILYPSRMQPNKKCLAIFPQNFKDSLSYVCIQDEVPETVRFNCLNSETFQNLV